MFSDSHVFPSVSIKCCLCWQMSAVGITENVKGDVKKFEIWYSGREEVYVIQVRMFKGRVHPKMNTTAILNSFSERLSFQLAASNSQINSFYT